MYMLYLLKLYLDGLEEIGVKRLWTVVGRADAVPVLAHAGDAGAHQQLYRIIPKTLSYAYLGKKLPLHGGGKSKRSFIHSNDFTDAIFKIINSNLVKEEYNFSTQEEISISELVERICQLTKIDKDKIIRYGPERPGKDMFYRMDINKAKLLLNWEPQTSLEKGLFLVNEWIQDVFPKLSKESWSYEHRN